MTSPTYQRPPMVGTALLLALGYVVTIWGVFIVNTGVFGGALNYFGIHPLDVAALWHILISPLLHANLSHLVANTVPGAVFIFLIGFSGKKAFWEVTAITLVVSGIGTWVFGGIGTNHIGASGLVYGWLAYLIVRGLFNRSFGQVIVGVVLAFAYGGLIWGVLPGVDGVSWQSHLCGALGGMLAGAIITSDDPPALQARRARRVTSRP